MNCVYSLFAFVCAEFVFNFENVVLAWIIRFEERNLFLMHENVVTKLTGKNAQGSIIRKWFFEINMS